MLGRASKQLPMGGELAQVLSGAGDWGELSGDTGRERSRNWPEDAAVSSVEV